LPLKAEATGSSRSRPPRNKLNYSRDPLLGFGSSSEDTQAPSRRLEPSVSRRFRRSAHAERRSAAPPLRFRPLQRFPAQGSGMKWLDLPRPTASAFRFSQPPGAFIRPEPAGLVPCRIRSWGHPPELSSSHAAVRRSRRHSPHDVSNAFRVSLRVRVHHSTQRFRLEPSA